MADFKFFRSCLTFSLSCLLAMLVHRTLNHPAVKWYVEQAIALGLDPDQAARRAKELDCHLRGDCFFPDLCDYQGPDQHFCCHPIGRPNFHDYVWNGLVPKGRPNLHREGCGSLWHASNDYVESPDSLDEHIGICFDAVHFNPWRPRNEVCLTALEAELCTVHRLTRRRARRLGYEPRALK